MSNDNDMPVMPGLEKPGNESEQVDLNVPEQSQEDVPVEIIDPEKDMDSNVQIPIESKLGIEVVASRKGFFGQQRYKENDKFKVKKFGQLGSWMRCIDPVMEKKRSEFFKNKNKKASK